MFGGYKKKKVLSLATQYVTVPESDWQTYYEKLGEVLRRARLHV